MQTAAQKNNSKSKTPSVKKRIRSQKQTNLLPNEITTALGESLQRYRHARKMTQFDVATEAEVARTRISKLETGIVNPSVLSLATICHVLGITLADLFSDIRLTHPPTTQGGSLRRQNQAVLDKKPPKSKKK
jgi:DNA-binding XRE family transcriptional regulator